MLSRKLCAVFSGSSGNKLDLTLFIASNFTLYSQGGSSVHSDSKALIPLLNDTTSARSLTEQSRASFFIFRGSLRGNVLVVSPFLVEAVAREGGMEMCVIHPFCLKYVRVKELKTDFHIPYATEFYLYASIRKPGKIITKNVRHVQMVKKNSKSLFWCWVSN